jgi:hypothetical protein
MQNNPALHTRRMFCGGWFSGHSRTAAHLAGPAGTLLFPGTGLLEDSAHCRSHFVYPTDKQAYKKQDYAYDHSYSKCFSSRIHRLSPG